MEPGLADADRKAMPDPRFGFIATDLPFDLLPELPRILRANQIFHLTLAQFAGNQRVTDQLELILGYVSRLDTLCTQTVPGWIGHTDILHAIESREPGEARNAMHLHIELSRDKMIKLFST